MIELHSASQVHLGLLKKNNEDYIAFFEPADAQELQSSGCLYVLADGVGGAARGERASQYAADKVVFEYFEHPEVQPAERLRTAIASAGADIYAYASESARVTRMATTIVAAVIRDDTLLVANVGDSRAYLIRGGQVSQLTHDHSVVGEMVASGQMTEEEAMASKIKNRLTRSVGGEAEVQVESYAPVPLRKDDRVLLCSDGLTRYANQQKIAELASHGTPEEIVDHCVSYANERGGADNISVIAIGAGVAETAVAPAPAAPVRPHMPERAILEDAPTDPYAVRGAARKPAWRIGHASRRRRRAPSILAPLAIIVVVGTVLTVGGLWLVASATRSTAARDDARAPADAGGVASPFPTRVETAVAPTATDDPRPEVRVNTSGVCLQAPQDPDCDLAKGYEPGTTLRVISQDPNHQWFFAEAPDLHKGWVFQQFVHGIDAASAIPADDSFHGLCVVRARGNHGMMSYLDKFGLAQTYSPSAFYERCELDAPETSCIRRTQLDEDSTSAPSIVEGYWLVIAAADRNTCVAQADIKWVLDATQP